MRIDVHFDDRVGIAHEILATLARRALDVSAVEVDPPHIYLEAPALSAQDMAALRSELFKVPGVQTVDELEMLPGARRRLYLDALLASQTDPVLAVDGRGVVMVANAAAVLASGVPEAQLTGMSLQALTGDAALAQTLIDQGYRLPASEVQIGGERYLLETVALHDTGGTVAGAVLTLHAPQRLGERLSALQNYSAGGFESILGQSPAIRQLKQRAARMALVDAPLVWAGTLDQMPISRGAQTSTIGVTALHRGVTFRMPKPLRYTDNDQQVLVPGDTGLRYVLSQSQHQDIWPAASFFRQ